MRMARHLLLHSFWNQLDRFAVPDAMVLRAECLRPSLRRGSNILEEFPEKLCCGVGWIKGVVLSYR
jgi:hypothetical protein